MKYTINDKEYDFEFGEAGNIPTIFISKIGGISINKKDEFAINCDYIGLDVIQKAIGVLQEEIEKNKIKTTFRIIYFPVINLYVGMAYNYNVGMIISTIGYDTYTEAKVALEEECKKRNAKLQYFDGEYRCEDGETLIPLVG
jgi:hypothetical protein